MRVWDGGVRGWGDVRWGVKECDERGDGGVRGWGDVGWSEVGCEGV